MRRKNKLLYGVGVNDFSGSCVVNGGKIKSYDFWKSMLCRCYNPKYHLRKPTYIGCSVCSEWLCFSNFKEWFDINYVEGCQLDKDILIEGNKVYSPKSCRFIPGYINSLLNDRGSVRGDLPIGVSKNGNGFTAHCSNGNGDILHKYCSTLSEAKSWYYTTKKSVVKSQADKALTNGSIGEDVYFALVSREF